MTDFKPSLATVEGALSFVRALHDRVRSAAKETRGFSPVAFVFATRDPVTQEEFSEPKPLPLSVDLLFDAMTDAQRELVLDNFEDPSAFLTHIARISADKGKAVGVVTLISGDSEEGTVDPITGKLEVGTRRRSVLMFLEHQRSKPKSWLADLSEDDAEDFQIGEFIELDEVPNGVDPCPLLPTYN